MQEDSFMVPRDVAHDDFLFLCLISIKNKTVSLYSEIETRMNYYSKVLYNQYAESSP